MPTNARLKSPSANREVLLLKLSCPIDYKRKPNVVPELGFPKPIQKNFQQLKSAYSFDC